MRQTLTLLALCTCPLAYGQASLNLHLGSYHFERVQSDGTPWRETNPGLGVSYEAADSLWIEAGGYWNSYDKETLYAGVRYEPLRYGRFALGGMVAGVTGYPAPVGVALTVSARFKGGSLGLYAFPPAPHGGTVVLGLTLRLTNPWD